MAALCAAGEDVFGVLGEGGVAAFFQGGVEAGAEGVIVFEGEEAFENFTGARIFGGFDKFEGT